MLCVGWKTLYIIHVMCGFETLYIINVMCWLKTIHVTGFVLVKSILQYTCYVLVKNLIQFSCYLLVLFGYMCFVLSCLLVVVVCFLFFYGWWVLLFVCGLWVCCVWSLWVFWLWCGVRSVRSKDLEIEEESERVEEQRWSAKCERSERSVVQLVHSSVEEESSLEHFLSSHT